MAECQCNISTGMLSPGVFNIKQFLNETEEMRWTVSSRFLNGGIDLADYDAFLVLQRGSGEPDEVLLTSNANADNITLIWAVGDYATWLTGYVKYQIVFRSKNLTDLQVFCTFDERAHGTYSIDNPLAEGIYRTWTNKDYNNYQINYKAEFFRWQLTKDGEVIAYQDFPNENPCMGQWKDIAVGNATACVWRSLEAVMYISESIPADMKISAKYATILRQWWQHWKDMIIKSGVSAIGGAVTANNWVQDGSEYYIEAETITGEKIITGCVIVDTTVYEEIETGVFSSVEDIRIEQDQFGEVRVYAPRQINGKIVFSVKAGNGYCFVREDAFGNLLEFTNSAVTSVNGKTGAVTLRAADFGLCDKDEVENLIATAIAKLTWGKEIDNLETALGNTNGRVTKLETNLTNLTNLEKSDITAIKKRVTKLETQYNELQGLISTATAILAGV